MQSTIAVLGLAMTAPIALAQSVVKEGQRLLAMQKDYLIELGDATD